MTIDEQIEVMIHFRDGGQVETKHKGGWDWSACGDPRWEFRTHEYRKKSKPEPKYMPWTAETISASYVRDKSWPQGFYVSVLAICEDKIIVLNAGEFHHVSYTSLLDDWETRDGKPCGMEVEG